MGSQVIRPEAAGLSVAPAASIPGCGARTPSAGCCPAVAAPLLFEKWIRDDQLTLIYTNMDLIRENHGKYWTIWESEYISHVRDDQKPLESEHMGKQQNLKVPLPNQRCWGLCAQGFKPSCFGRWSLNSQSVAIDVAQVPMLFFVCVLMASLKLMFESFRVQNIMCSCLIPHFEKHSQNYFFLVKQRFLCVKSLRHTFHEICHVKTLLG